MRSQGMWQRRKTKWDSLLQEKYLTGETQDNAMHLVQLCSWPGGQGVSESSFDLYKDPETCPRPREFCVVRGSSDNTRYFPKWLTPQSSVGEYTRAMVPYTQWCGVAAGWWNKPFISKWFGLELQEQISSGHFSANVRNETMEGIQSQ